MNEAAALTEDLPEQTSCQDGPPEAWVFPASISQLHLWRKEQAAPGNPAHHIPGVFRIRGRLDASLLERSLRWVIDRHEILRTSFREVDGEPVQIVAASAEFRLPVIDLRPLPGSARDGEAARIVREEIERPFDLSKGPLVRALLLELTPAEQRLVIAFHQTIADCYSQEIFLQEVVAVYTALTRSAAPDLAALPIQFADFATWQRTTMQGKFLQQEQAFWREKLAGVKPLAFPAEENGREPRGGTCGFALPDSLGTALRAVARREGVSLFMALLAGWKILLARRTGQSDIVVATPVAGRERTETSGLIGCFLNTLLLRTDLSGNPPAREALHRVRAVALEALTHQDLPFEMVSQGIKLAAASGKEPLLQAMFVLMTGEEKSWAVPPAEIEPLGSAEPEPRFDVMLRLRDTGRALTGVIVYDTAIFKPESIRQMAADYTSLLAEMAARPEARIDSLFAAERPTPPEVREEAGEVPACGHAGTWLEATLVEVWEEIFKRRPIAVTDDFFDLGGDSLLAIRMLVETGKRTGIQLPPRLAFEYPTIRQLAAEARRPSGTPRSPLVAVQTAGSKPPFFFLHGDFVEGGLYCVHMARKIGSDRPFYAIEPHGVYDEPPNSIEEMAASRLELVRRVRPTGPYVLGGFCNGGLVAFEMARQLEAMGETVSSLILLSVDGSNAEFSWLERLIGIFPGSSDAKFRAFLEYRERILFARAAWKRQVAKLSEPVPISRQPRRAARKAVRVARKAFDLLFERSRGTAVDATQPKAAGLDIGLIYHQACKAYVPRPYRGAAHVLWPTDLPLRDAAAGWGSVMPRLKLSEVPGGHFSSLQGENLLRVSEKIRACLIEDHA